MSVAVRRSGSTPEPEVSSEVEESELDERDLGAPFSDESDMNQAPPTKLAFRGL
jgi:hypothetical protein